MQYSIVFYYIILIIAQKYMLFHILVMKNSVISLIKLSGKTKPVKTLSTNLIEILLAAALATVTKTLDRM